MNYDLAKELKDNGFPERTRVALELNLRRYFKMTDPSVTYPFLQELIAELEESLFFLLTRSLTRTEWIAEALRLESYVPSLEGRGSTPEEALARLWLALNKP